MKHSDLRSSLTTISLAFILSLTLNAVVRAQGKQAVVLLRSGNSSINGCDGTADMSYQTIYDLRLNNKDEVRLLGSPSRPGGDGGELSVSRKTYEDATKNKLTNLYGLKWQNNLLYAVSPGGQGAILVLPEEMKPQRNDSVPMSTFYNVMMTGEARDGKQKRKVSIALREVWKIYFIPDGGSVNDTLYAHAAEEKSVVIWESFLQKTNNYRQADANVNMRDVLVACARSALEQFNGGNYKALDLAKQRTERAQAVRSDAETDKLLAEISQQRKRVNDAREQVYTLIGADRWDDAIAAAEPIKIYLSSWDDLNSKYNEALKRSHDQHLFKGEQALQNNQLDAALSECTIAWKRLSDSKKAQTCYCSSSNRVALRDSSNFRQRKQPKAAVELLDKQLRDNSCTRDEAVVKEFGVAKCEYSQQLFNEARLLVAGGGVAVRAVKGKSTPAVGGLKAVLPQNKPDFRSAREKLMFAVELCPDEAVKALLDKVNRSLSDYCVAEARKALQRNSSGTAYVYLMSAQGYTPDNELVNSLLAQSRDQFEEKTRVSIGVVFENKSGYRNSRSLIDDVSSEIEAIATRVGLAQPQILDRGQSAAAWRALQNATNLPSPTAIFSGDLLGADVKINYTDRTVRSYYLEENPEWRRRENNRDVAEDQYNQCKKQYSKESCVQYKNQVENLNRQRDAVDRNLKYPYNYYERYFKVTGGARLSFRYTDSISRSVRAAETLASSLTDECLARSGVDSRDRSVSESDCSRIEESVYLDKMTRELRSQASLRAEQLLRELPLSYYKRAKSSTNKQQSIEDFLRFLFLTSNKGGGEAEEAKKTILSFDAELKTDGVLR